MPEPMSEPIVEPERSGALERVTQQLESPSMETPTVSVLWILAVGWCGGISS